MPLPSNGARAASQAANLQVTYDFTEANYQKDAPFSSKCLTGYTAVKHTAGAPTAQVSLDMSGYATQSIEVEGSNGTGRQIHTSELWWQTGQTDWYYPG